MLYSYWYNQSINIYSSIFLSLNLSIYLWPAVFQESSVAVPSFSSRKHSHPTSPSPMLLLVVFWELNYETTDAQLGVGILYVFNNMNMNRMLEDEDGCTFASLTILDSSADIGTPLLANLKKKTIHNILCIIRIVIYL